MKVWKVLLPAILLIPATMGLISCSPGSTAASAQSQVVTVQRGDISIDITASGNLAFSQTEDLAFEVAGTVEDVAVKAGDPVQEGQVLAKLDTTTWDTQVTNLERALTAAQRKVTTTERQVGSAERQLTNATKAVTTTAQAKENARLQAEINLKNAQDALDKAQNTYAGPDIEAAQAAFDKASVYLEYALQRRADATGDSGASWDMVVARAQSDLNAAQKTLDAIKGSTDSDDIKLKKLQLTISQSNYANAVDAIAQSAIDTKQAVTDAQNSLDDVRSSLADAQTAVKDAQKALDDAKAKSPIIKAPFTGFVATVSVKGGDEIQKGTVAMVIADPNKFQTDILINEIDIPKVKVDGAATLQMSALTGLTFPGKITAISPTASISSGVVNYKVTVELTSSQPVMPKQIIQQRSQGSSSGSSQGTANRAQSPQQRSTGTGQPGAAQLPAVQLKQGLSTTVAITVQQKQNVVLVPNRAITRQGVNTSVQVVVNGVAEVRAIKTGLNDYQFTEVTEGLNEGDQVIIQSTTSASSTATPKPGQAGMFGGMGGIRIR